MNTQNSHCSYCGHPYDDTSWPRACGLCHNTTYSNPLPVVVMLLSAWDGDRLGALIQQRGIEPKKGEWALTGGYIDKGETWQMAAVREAKEELGLDLHPSHLHLMEVLSSDNNSKMLVFCNYTLALDLKKDVHFVPNEEVQAIQVIQAPRELAFPTHTQMLTRYMCSLY